MMKSLVKLGLLATLLAAVALVPVSFAQTLGEQGDLGSASESGDLGSSSDVSATLSDDSESTITVNSDASDRGVGVAAMDFNRRANQARRNTTSGGEAESATEKWWWWWWSSGDDDDDSSSSSDSDSDSSDEDSDDEDTDDDSPSNP